MLKISREQIKLFDKAIRRPNRTSVYDDLLAELIQLFPSLPEEELVAFIEAGLEKTEKYGIEEEAAIRDFIRLMIVAARDFDEHPYAHAQLTRADVSPDMRVQLMCELLTPADWQEASDFGPRASDRSDKDHVQKDIYTILSS